MGDLFAAMAVTSSVAAIVTDGFARDCDGIIATGLPVFVGGISPNSAAQSGPGSVGLPVVINNVRVAPGDGQVSGPDHIRELLASEQVHYLS